MELGRLLPFYVREKPGKLQLDMVLYAAILNAVYLFILTAGVMLGVKAVF